MKIWSIGMGILACAMSNAAYAQTAPFKCPKAGTVVEFGDGLRTIWLSAGDNYCLTQTRVPNGNEAKFHWFAPTLIAQDSMAGGYGNQLKPWTLWPLAVGKKLSARYDGAGGSAFQGAWLIEATVDGYERITTKIGTFDTFVVTRKEEALSHSFKSTLRHWYAPELGVVIKYSVSDSQGTNRASDATVMR